MGILEGRNLEDVPTIPEYFKGKTIFVTGGTGFMGKILIEKLLYSCSDLERIYLLMRCKKGVEPRDRIDGLYQTQCFDRLRTEKPDLFLSKVSIIPGDIMQIGLGMSAEDRAMLINSVDIVFHVAASVRFDDPLKYAVTMNLRGTQQVVELAREMKHLSSLVHVSTSYSNTNQNPVEEKIYPPHADWRDMLDICSEVDDHTVRVLTSKMLGILPNTYTFTKQLAENVVFENNGQLPAVIFRPSIVISSVEEPVKGWIENFNGPVGMLIASGKGIMRSLYTDPSLKADYMPVDIAIKAMIVAAWQRGTRKLEPTDDIPIYNCCSGNLNTITMGEIIELGHEILEVMPLEDSLWSVGGTCTTSPTIHYIKVLLFHLLPAIFVDLVLRLLGKKPILVKLQRRIYTAILALEYYVTQQWSFDNTHFIKLRGSIKQEDRQHFYYEIENVNKYDFFFNACKGGKKYLLKEKEENVPKAQAHNKRMYVIDKICKGVFFAILLYWLLNTECVQNIAYKLRIL